MRSWCKVEWISQESLCLYTIGILGKNYNWHFFIKVMFLGSTQFQSRCMTQVELQYKSLTYEFTLFFFFPKKHYFTLVSKQLHHRPQKIQQLSLWPSHQSGHSPHLKYSTSIHNSYNLVICTISIHNYSTWALLEAIGGNNQRGAWYFHSGPDDDLPTIGTLTELFQLHQNPPESSRIVSAAKIPARNRYLTTPHR